MCNVVEVKFVQKDLVTPDWFTIILIHDEQLERGHKQCCAQLCATGNVAPPL